MSDDKMHELLSRSLDEPLSPEEAALLNTALAASPELRALAADLRSIRELAATEPAVAAPPLPAALMARVERRYGPARACIFYLPRLLRHPLSLAAACLICLGLGYFLAERDRPAPRPTQEDSLVTIRTEVLQAQEQFHQAVAKMEAAAMDRIAAMPPELAHHFAQNLNIIDQAIRDCENITDKYLDNHVNYTALAKAYKAKVELLQLIMES